MAADSLRTRLILGGVIAAAGLTALAGIIGTNVAHRFPDHVQILHTSLVSAVALASLAAGWWYLRQSLSPIGRLRAKLADVRDGRASRVAGDYPAEVRPLVEDLNALLDDRERSITRALGKAGDLAHGLKTPLSVLAHEAERADAAGHHDFAAAIAHEIARMRRQVTYHLAHARAAASGATVGVRTPIGEAVDGLTRALNRLHADRGLTIVVALDPSHAVRCQREDLDEMLGNLLDNACRAARARVRVSSRAEGASLVVDVDDDGAGLAPAMREAVLRRGARADEAGPGTGLGLAIVGDLAELYGGSIVLSASPDGGLRATLTLPVA